MSIRHLLFGACMVAMAVSCKKETTNNNNVINAATYLNVSYGTYAAQKMDVYLPAGRTTTATKVMLLVHGGAWSSGDKTDLSAFIDTFKRRLPAYAFFNINYRLSATPANPFPTQEMDVKAALEYIYSKRNEYLISDNIVMAGASAGAHLALLQAYKYAIPVKAKAVVDFFGPTDMNDLYNNPGLVPQLAIAGIIGATPLTNPLLYQQSSPLNFVTNSAACPTIILQGSADLLVNAQSQSVVLKDKLLAATVPVQYVGYNGLGHGDWNSATYSDAFSKIQAFLTLYNP
ncbi:MAG: alpha/beta hydrolase [Chitinophagaceae bacterium]|nr:alpha/beta hydrolase [Chitinophagaceae bacterium]